jgi:hypothetical protein
MKRSSFLFPNKIARFIVLVFFLAVSTGAFAQAGAMSKNIITSNDKKYYLHKVAHAQSLFGIAKIYGVDVNVILAENPAAKKGIVTGQELKIPYNKVTTGQKPVEPEKAPEPAPTPTVEAKPEPVTTNTVPSQEIDLLSMAEDPNAKKEKEFTPPTFKSTRNINFHTCEILGRRALDFRISHRFGTLNSGAYNAWGLDGPANLMLSLEYSHTGRWMVGVQRSIQDKMGAFFFKWKILRQVKGGMPVTVTYFGGAYNTFTKDPYLGMPNKFYNNNMDRVSYVNQLIIASRITSWLSLQVAPTYVHYNLVGAANGLTQNDIMLLTGILRLKYSKRQAVIFEYGFRFNTDYAPLDPAGNAVAKYYNTMGIGWEIETGGHVFQIFATNSYGILENQFLALTDGDWSTMGVRLGFNITRVFSLAGKKKTW